MSENQILKYFGQLINPMIGQNHRYESHIERPLDDKIALMPVEIKLRNTTDNTEMRVHALVKFVPRHLQQSLPVVEKLYRKEIVFYSAILPALQNFRIRQGLEALNCFTTFHSSRLSLDPDPSLFDRNAVLVFEDLQTFGYNFVQNYDSFDLGTTLAVLKQLAKFHATPIALKLYKIDELQRLIGSHFEPLNPNNASDVELKRSFMRKVVEILKYDRRCRPHLKKIESFIELTLRKYQTWRRNCPESISKRFGTIIHSHLYVYSVWHKSDIFATSLKICDFSDYEFASLAREIVFVLFSSVEIKVLDTNYDFLILFYYRKFIKELRRFKFRSPEVFFDYGKFREEIRTEVVDFEFVRFMSLLVQMMTQTATERESHDIRDRIVFIVKKLLMRGYIK